MDIGKPDPFTRDLRDWPGEGLPDEEWRWVLLFDALRAISKQLDFIAGILK